MKRQSSFVSINPQEDTPPPTEFELMDGRKVVLSKERFLCTEILFQGPTSLQTQISQAISFCDKDVQRDLWNSIILTGGGCHLPGLRSRLAKELKTLFPKRKMTIIDMEDPDLMSFVGASILASLSTFQKMWISSYEYEDSGSSIVHRKCP